MVEESFFFDIKVKLIDTHAYREYLAYHRGRKGPEDTCYFFYNQSDIQAEVADDYNSTTLVENLYRFGFSIVNSTYVE